ncbi:RING-H2 finger protein ATL13 [Rhynchospora pubera]|uniref:RING-H2 finger protein ATL13 n=1 Tax=Rhynchospora pubera TaxID=906938 RepID=A0AAV8GHJ7_9POAL|nr:RING-H2 finger protein ATL13 [Rhynchospora pubera]
MGFPSLSYCVILPKPILLIFQLLDFFRYAISLFIYRIGLTNSVEYYPLASLSSTVDCLTFPPTSAIKSQLRLVKLSNLHLWKRKHGQTVVCAVCLGQLSSSHEVRELGNCSHLFHKECIDKWVDLGKVTCPLCRALLLPNGIGRLQERTCFNLVRWRNY